VELEISAGAGIEAELRTLGADAQQRAVTEHILALADQAGYGAALIDAVALGHAEAAVISWPQFAHMVRAAARGLSRRGLQQGDTAGIFVGDAVSHAVAVHAVRAAGAVAAAVRPTRSATDIAAQLKQSRARLLITSADLADLAIQAAERSWVRQVFAFGEAEGTTPFDSLLQTPRHGQHQAHDTSSNNGHNGHNGHNGGSNNGHNGSHGHAGGPAPAQVSDLAGLGPDGLGPDGLGPDGLGPEGSAPQLIHRPVPRLTYRDVVVAAPPSGDPEAYTSLLDLALAAGATVVAAPLAQVTAAIGVYKGTAAIVPRGTGIPGLPAGRVLAVG
jgi:AMP-binding enzyme